MSGSVSSLTDTVQSLPSANLSEKTGKRKSKKQILDAGLPAPESQQKSGITTPPDGNLGNGESSKNPYIELIGKRLKAIKKKLNKLEKYEETEKEKLNEDQLASIKAKPELVGAYRELEEILKQLEKIEIEEQQYEQQRRREVEAQNQIIIEEAVKAERARNEALIINTLRFFDLVHKVNEAAIDRTYDMNSVDTFTILHLHALVIDSAISGGEPGPFEYLEKLQRREEENVTQDITTVSYARLHMLQDQLVGAQDTSIGEANEQPALDEVAVAENGFISNGKDMAEDLSQQEVTVSREEEEDDDDGEHLQIHIPQGGIQFMTDSEIFDVPEDSTTLNSLIEPAVVSDLVNFPNEPSLPTDTTFTSPQEGQLDHIQQEIPVSQVVNQQDQRPQHRRGHRSNSYRSRGGNQQQSQSQQHRQDQYRHDQYRSDTATSEGDQRGYRGRGYRGQKSGGGYRGSQQGQGQGKGGAWAMN